MHLSSLLSSRLSSLLMATRPAHGGSIDGWHDVPGKWAFDVPVIVATIVLCGLAFVGRRRRRTPSRHQLAATAGVTAILVALVSPLDRMADQLFSAHMVQHLVLVGVAAPAIACWHPWRDVRAALPRRWRRRAASVARSLNRTQPFHAAVATAACIASLWLWHLPRLYDAAVRNDAVHAVEHGVLLASATWFWSEVLTMHARRHTPTALAMLAVSGMSNTALGMLLAFTGRSWFDAHPRTEVFGLSALADQQLAGTIMWILPSVGALVVMSRLFLVWLRRVPIGHEPITILWRMCRERLRQEGPARRTGSNRPWHTSFDVVPDGSLSTAVRHDEEAAAEELVRRPACCHHGTIGLCRSCFGGLPCPSRCAGHRRRTSFDTSTTCGRTFM